MLFALSLWKKGSNSLTAISILFCFLLGLSLGACASMANKNFVSEEGPLSILQGRTSSSEVELSILAPRASDLRIEIFNGLRAGQEPAIRKKISIPNAPWIIEKIKFENLSAGSVYSLRIFSGSGKLVDERDLKTFSASSESLKFSLISCTDDHFKTEQKIMWGHLKAAQPEVIFHVGDHVYADKVNGAPIWEADVDTLWKRYLQTRLTLDVFYWKDLVPMLLLWDDHDFGQNDGDVRYRNKERAAEIFQSFSAQSFPAEGFENGPGVSWSWNRSSQDFYFLDGRSFRSPNKVSPVCLNNSSPLCKKIPDLPGFKETHFGPEIEAWLFQKLQSSSRPAWLFSGDQWFGGFSPFESYEGNATNDFKRFVARLSDLPKTFVFGSGDRHAIEIMKIERGPLDFTTYEITSSPLHAKTFSEPWGQFPNPRNLEQFAGINNFIMIDASLSNRKKGLQFEVEGIGPGGQSLFKRKLRAQDPDELKLN